MKLEEKYYKDQLHGFAFSQNLITDVLTPNKYKHGVSWLGMQTVFLTVIQNLDNHLNEATFGRLL